MGLGLAHLHLTRLIFGGAALKARTFDFVSLDKIENKNISSAIKDNFLLKILFRVSQG